MAKAGDVYVGVEDLLVQLRIANCLLLAQLRPRLGQSELIRLLGSTGASYQDLADLLGTTASTISNALVRMRKTGKAKKVRKMRTVEEAL
jgi:hypothetical protein